MVIMESNFTGLLGDLSRKVDQLHLSYLEMEESSEKFEHRVKLEEAIADFLSEADESQKFRIIQTGEVLVKSVVRKQDFSAYKAATGWNALQLYAGNLLAQPWRREYRQIKTYCGFYKHQIEANLLYAEEIFGAMGYRLLENVVLVLEGPICPDQVVNVSRDCLVAYVECQIMKYIWEVFGNLSWSDIFRYRQMYPGSPEYCIKKIKYGLTEPPPGINPHSLLPPFNSRHNSGIQEVPTCCRTALQYRVPCSHIPGLEKLQGGYYCLPNKPRNNCDMIIQSSTSGPEGEAMTTRRSRTNSNVALEQEILKNGESLKNEFDSIQTERQRSEGDWDYVYRILEKQGYSKDLGDRGDVLVYNTIEKQRKYPKETKRIKMTNLDEVMNNLQITDKALKTIEPIDNLEQKSFERNTQHRERRHSQGSFYENVTPNDGPKSSKALYAKTLPKEKLEKSNNLISTVIQNHLPKERASCSVSNLSVSNTTPKWQCKSCTYLNNMCKDICDICSKSRNCPQETPIEVGGAECANCTLVNPKNFKICQACGKSLKDSPTYI